MAPTYDELLEAVNSLKKEDSDLKTMLDDLSAENKNLKVELENVTSSHP
jgi:regulator of replication initiation timing